VPPDNGRIDVEDLPPGAVLAVVPIAGFDSPPVQARTPHRHDYHELIWVREGAGSHVIDGREVPIVPGTVTIIGRGQVHVFREARGVHGAVVRLKDEVLSGRTAWLLAGSVERIVDVPEDGGADLEAVLRPLAAELERPADPFAPDVQRALVEALLLWVERWYDAGRLERQECDGGDLDLLRRFMERLEADFAHHHDAAHYAEALAVPAPALTKALVGASGRGTKEHVLDRVMLEARRLLRYTDASIGEIAFRVGYRDPLYFSRAFKRHSGSSPQGYRDEIRGRPAG
jgi:AraC family transcriptional activator of pobA